MTPPEERLGAAFVAMTTVWSLVLAAVGSHEALLFMAPVLLLVLPLAFGRYIAERRLASARTRLRAIPCVWAMAPPVSAPIAALVQLPRGGSLIANALAKRPPPHAAALT